MQKSLGPYTILVPMAALAGIGWWLSPMAERFIAIALSSAIGLLRATFMSFPWGDPPRLPALVACLVGGVAAIRAENKEAKNDVT